ncbi:MAG TPA: DUF3943 domain-containing protein [Kofleriaceae bacterium]|nr:DUF3943 domain-containing protein [Kofleriaceae bacterium]
MLHALVSCALLAALGPMEPAAALTEAAPREPFHLSRAARDLGVLMGLGVAWYVSQIEVNKRDFDFDRTFADQLRRLTGDGYRFDDNDRFLNIGHSTVGAYYHLLARANGGSMGQAIVFDLAASSAWELLVEHREVFSVNDTITTSVGGIALGEGLFRLGDLFARSRPTALNRVLMGVFSPARALTWLYGDDPRPAPAGFDEHGIAADAHHRFAVAVGGSAPLAGIDRRGWQSALAADLEVIDLPTYGRAGRAGRWLAGGEMTRMAVDFAGSARDMKSLSVRAQSSLWGRYRQDLGGDGDGGGDGGVDALAGYAAFVGSSTGFELAFDDIGELTDFLTAVHVFGASADVTLHRSPWRLRLAADVHPDFAMVRPFALGDAALRADGVPGQSTLKHGYYYALGVTAAARAEASYRQVRAGAAIDWSGYDAIEGLDRNQHEYTSPAGVHHDAIMDDPRMADRRLRLRLFVDAPLPLSGVRVGAGLELVQRAGTATGASRERDELRALIQAIYLL